MITLFFRILFGTDILSIFNGSLSSNNEVSSKRLVAFWISMLCAPVVLVGVFRVYKYGDVSTNYLQMLLIMMAILLLSSGIVLWENISKMVYTLKGKAQDAEPIK